MLRSNISRIGSGILLIAVIVALLTSGTNGQYQYYTGVHAHDRQNQYTPPSYNRYSPRAAVNTYNDAAARVNTYVPPNITFPSVTVPRVVVPTVTVPNVTVPNVTVADVIKTAATVTNSTNLNGK